MNGRFIPHSETEQTQLDWGLINRIFGPGDTESAGLVASEVTLSPGFGHDFHRHPQQEELIHVVSGQILQWLEKEKRELGPGDSVYIPADMVHASFNESEGDAKLLVILVPPVGEDGYELIDVSSESPLNQLRG